MTSGNSAWAELTAKFTNAGLAVPPMPEALRAQLSKQHEWCWSTRPFRGIDMYFQSEQTVVDVLRDQVPDYAAVSHAGHGINSYAINYHLVHGQLAVLMQVLWGGVYNHNAESAQRLAGFFTRIAELLDAPPAPAAAGRRLFVVFSDFRQMWGCSWIDRPAGPGYDLAVGSDADRREDPFDLAVRLWSRPDA